MAAFGGGQEEKAQQYIADAEKILKKKWSLFSSTTKNEDAAECYDKAARCYKVSGRVPACPLVFFYLSVHVLY